MSENINSAQEQYETAIAVFYDSFGINTDLAFYRYLTQSCTPLWTERFLDKK